MSFVDRFSQAKVLVLGDVMLDRYWSGHVERISPEAPVPIVFLDKTFEVAGGAANVAANVVSLGAEAYLVGVIGKDEEGSLLKKVLGRQGVNTCFLVENHRKTTVKTRVIAHNQHVIRIDSEQVVELSTNEARQLLRKIEKLIDQVDIVILSDYAKGIFLNKTLTSDLIRMFKSRNKKVIVDPKGKDFSKYKGADIITPNQKEAIEASGYTDIASSARKFLETLLLECVLITQGEKGMSIFEKDGRCNYLPAVARSVYDVTGAGDTVVATLALGVCSGLSYTEAAKIANIAAGIAVEQVGTSTVKKEELFERLKKE